MKKSNTFGRNSLQKLDHADSNANHLSSVDSENESQHDSGIASAPANIDWQSIEAETALCGTNKITNSNVWHLKIIDKLNEMVRAHHENVKNLRKVCPSLDATAKVYGMRVDSLYNDIVRISSSGRHRTKSVSKNPEGAVEDEFPPNENVNVNKAKRKRPKSGKCNIVKNKGTINGRLDTIPMPDPIISKAQATPGDMAAPNRLFLYILPTKWSDFQLTANDKFWDDQNEDLTFDEDDSYHIDGDHIKLPMAINIDERLTLRQSLAGYCIADGELDDSDTESETSQRSYGTLGSIDTFHNPYIESMDFDPETPEDANVNEIENPADISALTNSLSRDIAATGPIGANRPEYTYRTIDRLYKNYWAGPSYWKPSRMPMPSEKRTNPVAKNRNRKSCKTPAFDDSDDGLFVPLESQEAKKIRKCCYANWVGNEEKLKLPPKANVKSDFFHNYVFLPGASTLIQPNQNNAEDDDAREHVDDDDNSDHLSNFEDFNDFEMAIPIQNSTSSTPTEIELKYEGAPEVIAPITVNFVRKAKVVNMRRLRASTWEAVQHQFKHTRSDDAAPNFDPKRGEEYENGIATFSGVNKIYQKTLPLKMLVNVSRGLAFFSMLTLCNENSLRLQHINHAHNKQNPDFVIRQVKK